MRKGFTLIQLLITLAIIAVLAIVATLSLSGNRRQADLKDATQQIASLLREAQSNTMSQEKGVSWGVHLENAAIPFYALFASTTYSTSTVVGSYRLPASVGYKTSTLASGAALNITFSSPIGAASASTSISLYSLGSGAFSSTISVASTGAISY